MSNDRRQEELFTIGAVADMFDLNPQTIRLYEKKGLINPNRTPGGTRMFSWEDIEQLKTICHLLNDLGVNLAGVEVIMNMKKHYEQREQDMKKQLELFLGNLSKELFAYLGEHSKNALVRIDRQVVSMVKFYQTMRGSSQNGDIKGGEEP